MNIKREAQRRKHRKTTLIEENQNVHFTSRFEKK